MPEEEGRKKKEEISSKSSQFGQKHLLLDPQISSNPMHGKKNNPPPAQPKPQNVGPS